MFKKTQESTKFTNNFLSNKIISVIGYNYNYGRSHALNIKDNNHNIIVGTVRYNDDWKKAINDGCYQIKIYIILMKLYTKVI